MIVVINNMDEIPLVDYLKDVIHAARDSYECNPMQPQPKWEDLTDEEKIEEMEATLIADLEFDGWYFKVIDESNGHQKFTMLKED